MSKKKNSLIKNSPQSRNFKDMTQHMYRSLDVTLRKDMTNRQSATMTMFQNASPPTNHNSSMMNQSLFLAEGVNMFNQAYRPTNHKVHKLVNSVDKHANQTIIHADDKSDLYMITKSSDDSKESANVAIGGVSLMNQ